ncbi:PUX7 [Symbiodinium sp. CCMP2592]|nr:PUX7 [Symbiodinium sp. CCMP2592]
MPIPYPAACDLDPGKVGDTDLKRIITNLLVISFNYLDLGRAARAPDGCLRGGRLSEAQWEQVLRLESFLDAWFEIGILTAETMGRTAGKIEDLERVVSSLRGWKRDHLGADTAGHRKSCECGTFRGPKISTFKQVDASRLQFRGRPEFDPRPYLDSATAAIYEDPFKHSVSPEKFEGAVPHVKVHCSRSERIKLYELLDSSGRIQLFRPEQVRAKYTSGVFAVLKSLSLDRLILDSRPHNLLESPPGKFIRTLGAADTVCRLHLEPGEWLYTSTNDIRDFYHLFRVGTQRSCRNALVGTVTPGEVKHFKSFRDSFRSEAKLYAGLSCLAMGDTQAVEIAQTCHVGLLFQSGLLHERNLLCMGVPAPREQTCTGVVIDDHVALSIERRGPDSVKFAPTDGAILADTAQEIYKGVNLIPHEAKAVRDSLHGEFWGLQVDGGSGLVRGSLKRAVPLLKVILDVLELGIVTVNLLEIIAGGLIALFVYRRRLMCLLQTIFSEIAQRSENTVLMLGFELKEELVLCCLLLTSAVTDLKAQYNPNIFACDASGWGEAVVFLQTSEPFAKEMYRFMVRYPKISSCPEAAKLNTELMSEHFFVQNDAENYLEEPLDVWWPETVKEIERALPYTIGGGIYSGLAYSPTSINPSDGPTRGRDVGEPSEELPSWYEPLLAGDVGPLDSFLNDHGCDPLELAGVPPLSELVHPGKEEVAHRIAAQRSVRTKGLKQLLAKVSPHVVFDRLREAAGHCPSGTDGEARPGDVFPGPCRDLACGIGTVVWPDGVERSECLKNRGYLDLFSGIAPLSEWGVDLSVRAFLEPLPQDGEAAMVSIALSWQWPRFGLLLLIAFYGIMRIGEVLQLTRAELVLPSDLLSDKIDQLYVKVSAPKTRLPATEKLFPLCAQSFRRRWDSILQQLQVPTSLKITPASVRGGGAVFAYQSGVGVADLVWRMNSLFLAAGFFVVIPLGSRLLQEIPKLISGPRTAAKKCAEPPDVNIQQAEVFASHTLNRDVWSDDTIKDIITGSFLFWQRDDKSAEGDQFCHLHQCGHQLPHICVIDPRTGRRVKNWDGRKWVESHAAAEYLFGFLDQFSMSRSPPSMSPTASPVMHPKASPPDPSQIRLHGLDDMEVEGVEAKEEPVPVLPEEPAEGVEHLKVSLRLPSGQRVARRFRPDDHLEQMFVVAAALTDKPTEKVDLATQFPTRSLREIEGGLSISIKEAKVAGNLLLVVSKSALRICVPVPLPGCVTRPDGEAVSAVASRRPRSGTEQSSEQHCMSGIARLAGPC